MLGGEVAFGEIDGGVGAFHCFVGMGGGLFDDVVIAGESGERHELRGTVVHAHVRTRARAMMRQVDDVIVTVGLLQTHAA